MLDSVEYQINAKKKKMTMVQCVHDMDREMVERKKYPWLIENAWMKLKKNATILKSKVLFEFVWIKKIEWIKCNFFF